MFVLCTISAIAIASTARGRDDDLSSREVTPPSSIVYGSFA
jgi:hypothetical protein